MNESVNPTLLLACARRAFPQFAWKIFPGSDTTVFDGRGGSFSLDLRCQMALQIALERSGWLFRWLDLTQTFAAYMPEDWADPSEWVTGKTKPELLAACVAQEEGCE